MTLKRLLLLGILGATLCALALWLAPGPAAQAYTSIDSTCVTSPSPVSHSGTALDTFTPTRNGVTYETTSAALKLVKKAAQFQQTTLGISSNDVKAGCAADFDKDGWVDFVATGDDQYSYVRFYKNRTYDNPAPDWTDPTKIRTPKFVAGPDIAAANNPSNSDIGCGDFNGDGNMDFFVVRCTNGDCDNSGTPSIADMYMGKGDGTFKAKYSFLTTPSGLSKINWWGTSAVGLEDYNKDGKPDMVWALSNGTDNSVVVLLNGGGAQPKFDTRVTLLPTSGSLGFSAKVAGLGLADVNRDGILDLVIGSPDTNTLRYYPGLSNSTFGPYQTLATGFGGSANNIYLADFSLDGNLDLIVSTDGHFGNPGGEVYYWRNNGTNTPFSDGVGYTNQTAASDFDMGWVFDYDHDPDHTPDFVAADGNDSAKYFLFANRTSALYVTCGLVASGVIDIGDLANQDMTITAVRIAPTPGVPSSLDGTVTWEASIDGGNTWHTALACADNANNFCATFDTSAGNQIRWRANMCSNSNHTRTPYLTQVNTTYTYVLATNHFRAGPIAKDGVIYVGAFREPGDSGHIFALDDASGGTLWDGGVILDDAAASTRNIFTAPATQNPTTCEDPTKIAQCRYDFKTTAITKALKNLLLASDSTVATDLINWWTSARFGLREFHVFGGVVNSTAALLSHPAPPIWFGYTNTSQTERDAITAYDTAYANRPQMIFVGAEDGALHAFLTNPADPTDALNGKEAWAYIPTDVATRLLADKTSGTITAYPDSSPTLLNAKIQGKWRTVLVSGEGNGGKSIYALDVTDTVTVNNSNHTFNTTGKGPIPLWQYTAVGMGHTFSKPTVIRTKINSAERWLAVFASGPITGSDVGDTVYAIDMDTGSLLWRFDVGDANCYITTDITASETDDENGTSVDGYTDRLFFGDNKGRIWKIDPASFSGTTMASVSSTVNVGLTYKALFATKLTSGGLGVERAISGTITAAPDASKRLVLYFGTGGTEDTPGNAQNAFYGVYADTGDIRSKLDGSNGIVAGVKFYGGVVYQDGQIVFTSGKDLSGLGLCSSNAGTISAIDANSFTAQFSMSTTSKIMAPLYAVNGEIYSVTMTGGVTTSAYTGAAAGSGSGGSGGSANSTPGAGSTSQPFTVMAWHQIK